MPEPSILDERLAEIDRRLRTIQSGLAPVPDEQPAAEQVPAVSEPVAAAAPPAREPALDQEPEPEPLRLVEPGELTAPERADQLAGLIEAHERLLELHRELLSQYAEVLERRATESATIGVTAGPFETAGNVRAFERALAALPGVSAVTVREYLGDDRVQVDVRLAG